MTNILDFFSKHQTFIITGSLALALFSFIDKALAAGALFAFFLTAVSLFVISKGKEEKQRKILGALFLIIFAIYILSALFFYYTKFQPFSDGYGDYIIYGGQAEQITKRIHQGNFSLQGLAVEGISLSHFYPVVIGYIYAFTIPSMLLGQIFSAWMVAVAVCFVYLIVGEMGGTQKEGFLTGLIASLYPSLAFYGSLLLKESLVIALALMALFLALKIIKKFSVAHFFLLYAVLIALTNLRFYISYAVVLAFVVGWLAISNVTIKKRITYAVIMLLLFGFLPQISCGYGYFGANIVKQYVSVQYITFYREVAYTPSTPKETVLPSTVLPSKENTQLQGEPSALQSRYSTDKNSTVSIKAGFENPITFVKNTTLSFLHAFFGPLPWKFTKLSQFFALPEIIASYFIVFFALMGIVESLRKKHFIVIPLIFFSLLIMGMLAIFMNNFGLVTRIRMPAFLALLCLAPLGFKKLGSINIPLFKKLLA